MRQLIVPILMAAVVATPAFGQATPTKKSTAKATTAAVKRTSSTNAKPTSDGPWKVAYTDPTVTVSIDPSVTKKWPDGSYLTRMRWLYVTDQEIESKKLYRTMVEDRLVDCVKVRTKSVNATALDANGKTVSSFTTPASDLEYLPWSTRKAGSTSAKALAATCKAVKIK